MSERIYMNDHWKFSEQFHESMITDNWTEQMQEVRIPHTVRELPFHYFDESLYQMEAGYQRCFCAEEAWFGKRIVLTFDGVAQDAEVYLNGTWIGAHHCGYTAFSMDISTVLRYGEENLLTVRVDSRETLNIPPFGHVVDYMTYGGIYRDVYLDIREKENIGEVFLKPRTDVRTGRTWLETDLTISDSAVFGRNRCEEPEKNCSESTMIRQMIRRSEADEYQLLGEQIITELRVGFAYEVSGVELWSPRTPVLYEVLTQLICGERICDEVSYRVGFRQAEFRTDGFYLNGEKFRIFGLNRHQSYPYVGYAMPDSMQREDARILKYELGLNAVRTSHYPQSHAFLDQCDELGLLVFTEIPGWQHIGDEQWKKQAVQNTEDMVRQYRNHTSIILWGVRINESKDDDEFYQRTNAVARLHDDTRPTGGVRAHKKSSLLEDVYTYNDFVHAGGNQGCEKKRKVTSDDSKAYMVTEYNGHMYPTKAFDCGSHRTEHAVRHATVLNAVRQEHDIAGSFGWCFADYNTHKDFGSGDRICYHGVMDMFRNPKLAAAVYASQQERTPVLEVTTSFDIGEQPGGVLGREWILTNADEVRMYKNEQLIKIYRKEDSAFPAMMHGPILLDDYIGNQLDAESNLKPAQKEAIRQALNDIARYGLPNVPKRDYLLAAKLLIRYRMTPQQLTKMYERYIGNWGGAAPVYRLEAVCDGVVVKTIQKSAMHQVHLEVTVSHRHLTEGKTYDVASIRIRAVDENGNLLPYYQQPICVETEGPLEIIGPNCFGLQGGMGGTYVRTTGKEGEGILRIIGGQAGNVTEQFTIEREAIPCML